ncbi:gamma-aminobutyric acid receptor subunit beta-4-like [Exaiptasia diaphana]|uniref:Gamma-aminobutyric acid receptor subunit beta n=1 Tax=Exaiptasia diaphana TaxID=2652724 RepID=A0A913YL14_EXADI|nr:gamma-aminobutyric acid receptor subunit beta-4-like [Exaiptasia diaphana]XP_028516122.1 gamma-aminobutyric acid receptor subunit beta-4-like [Exaiptasia diaphana]XP_028516123.1 gamma-aminobutyric acid receptor subunit beta-4-like [Exaiptasia diaphana]XP_028516124.1 gamma-aminobutyric acid receptor subunit beta-4-like [Exaiptasia diaphana]XP_028516125.1 gamma-aminobutyric acid receptor subunit beta-4-like [Exaiptasia diaphana]
MNTLFLLLAIAVSGVSSLTGNGNSSVSSILDRILKHEKYDKRLRPSYGDGPVVVTVGFWVLSIDSINVVDMDYTLDIFLRQSWRDERMAHELNTTMFLSNTVMDKIWMPDSYFVNAKSGSFHKVTKDNMMIMIKPGGIVQYNARVTIRLSCPMDLRAFPMDTQHCPLTIESYGYSTKHIVFKWEIPGNDGLGFVPQTLKMLPQYKLAKVELATLNNVYVVGNWSGLKATFTFERLYSYFVIHVYGPCSLIVSISWVAFLLPREQAPARITLGVTSVLTVVTVLNMLNNSMPKVNYVKTIDKYLIGCFLFVFATLVEYSLVLWFSKAMKKYRLCREEWRKQHDAEEGIDSQVTFRQKVVALSTIYQQIE